VSATLDLSSALIRCASVTPADGGAQALLTERLAAAGFRIERLRFGEVENFWARRGTAGPLLCFAGHTDVVPTGPLDAWSSPPFEPVVRDGLLYGRGAADMKGALAAMVVAAEQFVAAQPDHRGSLAFLITGDEEGPSVDGTVRVMELLSSRGERIDWCLVGEPSSQTRLGDQVKHGRRGSLTGIVTVHGVQGHVAYPELADNPIHAVLGALVELKARRWDEGNADFPPTGFQVTNFFAGTGTTNVIPGEATLRLNFRYSTAVTMEGLRAEVEACFDRHGVKRSIEWRDAGRPFLTTGGALLDAVDAACVAELGARPARSTGGGTSDGRFIAPTGAEVVELGPVNASIHKVDECVAVADLEMLTRLYRRVMERLLAP
jgi:succinyl-diaminopimelate desuccinylase